MVRQPICHLGTGPGAVCCTQVLLRGCPEQRELFSFVRLDAAHQDREFRHRFCAVVGTSHQAIGPFPILRYDVIKWKLSGPEGHVQKLVSFM